MAQTTVMPVKVKQLSKYGIQIPTGEYMGLSKNFSESDKARLVPGAEFNAEVYIADSGKQYLNKIVQSSTAQLQAAVVASTAPDAGRTAKFTPKFQKKEAGDNEMSKAEWAAKDQRISRQGLIQAAVIALAPTMATEQLFDAASELATKMLGFVNPK